MTPELQQAEEKRIVAASALFRARTFTMLGWGLLVLSLVFLAIDLGWMWRYVGTRAAPLVAVGLVMDAVVGIALIIAGHRIRRKQ